ncbi:MAG: CHAT domain-containing protein [Terriglobales bacterium]
MTAAAHAALPRPQPLAAGPDSESAQVLAAQLDQEVAEQLRVDLRRAAELAAQARELARRHPERAIRAYALRARGNVLWFQGQHRRAAAAQARAAALFSTAGKPVEAARALSSSIQPLILCGEYARARAAGRCAQRIFAAHGEATRLARLEINLGNIDHRQDRFPQALAHYQRAYDHLLALGPRPAAGGAARQADIEGIIAALHNIAMCSIVTNDYVRARQAHAQARQLCVDHHLPRGVIQADYNIAYLHYFRGDYARAIEMLRAAREAAQRLDDPYLAALCPLDLAEIYVELHLPGEAIDLAEDAERRFAALGMGYEAAKARASHGVALCQQGQGMAAAELFAQARAAFVREKNLVWPALMDLYCGIALHREGRWFEARRDAEAALAFFSAHPLPGRVLACRLLLAQLELDNGQLAAAREQARAARTAMDGREPPLLRQQARRLLGEIAERSGRPRAAARHYLAGQKILESLRGAIHGEELKISFLRQRLAVYENLAGLCADPAVAAELAPLGPVKELAWHCIEQAKSRALRDRVAAAGTAAGDGSGGEAPAAGAGGAPRSALVARIRALREDLQWYHHRLQAEQLAAEPAPAARLATLQQAAEQRERQFIRALRQLPATADAAGLGLDPQPVTIAAMQASLGPATTLVEFFRVREQILAAVLPPRGSLELVPLTLRARIQREMEGLRLQLSKFRLGPAYTAQFAAPLRRATEAHLAALYAELFAPLRGLLRTRELLIVPHEELHTLPFHAFHDGRGHLLDAYAIAYAPSATLYARPGAAGGAAASGAPLVLGVPDEQHPGIAAEAQAVAAQLPGARMHLGVAASREALAREGPNSRILHIATHGVFRPDNPLFSAIHLGDGPLQLHDLYALRLPAELITLSGCSTGLAAGDAGDERLGLARGLLAAGARNLLLTLWDVQDGSTAAFMQAFYPHLAAGATPAAALRAAMQAMRERYPHPFYWAPFQLLTTSPRCAQRMRPAQAGMPAPRRRFK